MSRAKAYTSLVKSRKLTETQKLRIMKQLDTAKTERDIRRISESISAVTTSVNTPKKKTNIAENKKVVGKFSKPIRTSLKENRKPVVGYDFADNLARLADIK